MALVSTPDENRSPHRLQSRPPLIVASIPPPDSVSHPFGATCPRRYALKPRFGCHPPGLGTLPPEGGDKVNQVMCTVDNCTYWGVGNRCEAKKILVTTDSVGESFTEDIDANQVNMLVEQVGTTPAESCMETSCKTFKRH